jgi:hypothetical protein
MATINIPRYAESSREDLINTHEAAASAVSWGAVVGGAFVIASSSLILLSLGAGFGLSAVSPWSNIGSSASTVGTLAIVWLVVIEIIASALGGYLTGRLCIKWTTTHSDEVHFRDTASGFLAWAVALVVSTTFLASAASSMVGRAGQPAAGGDTNPASNLHDSNAYFVDALFRSDRALPEGNDTPARAEAARILSQAVRLNQMPVADRTYLAESVAARTGIAKDEAEQRVSNAVTQARSDEDSLQKATAHFLLWLFLALLTGAFSASYAAVVGGRQRDSVKAV